MQEILLILLFGPFMSAAFYSLLPRESGNLTIIAAVAVFSLSALYLHTSLESPLFLSLHLHGLILTVDYLLLGYFLYEGIKNRSKEIILLSLVQLALFTYFVFTAKESETPQIYLDSLATMMLLLINIVGGAILVYALDYMRDETTVLKKEKQFVALLLCFLGVMNFAVVSNNIEWFFLFFELTTLFSFLLIGFRKDEVSIQNALKALWMNQIGGVFILAALIYLATNNFDITFSALLASHDNVYFILPVALLSLAVMIKGAMFPFDRWLLGAMVAPTPVSAILHSATMVKIAPYMILRLSESIAASGVGILITLFGAIVFFGASFIALGKENLKEILAYSTIAMLSLAMALGATGNSDAQFAALMIIIFHGISKAILFMCAGIFEKKYHAKTLTQIQELLYEAPFLVIVTTIGFLSITIPPMGAFLGKMFAIEALSHIGAFGVVTLSSTMLIVFGSVALSVLYFRVIGSMVQKEGAKTSYTVDLMRPWYKYSLVALLTILTITSMGCFIMFKFLFLDALVGISHEAYSFTWTWAGMRFGEIELKAYYLIAGFLFLLSPILALTHRIKNRDRALEYSCGERFDFKFNMFKIHFFDANKKYFDIIGIIGFLSILVWSV